jgi:hypothetical protein
VNVAKQGRQGGARGDVDVAEEVQLQPGATIAGVRLIEPIETGTKVASWRGQRSGGSPVTIHALLPGARNRERDTFLKAAGRLAAMRKEQFMPGLVAVSDVVSAANLYVADGTASGTLADLPVLDWDFARKLGFVRCIGLVLSQIHRTRMFHGCVRPQNILLDEQLEPVLSDVGVIVLEDSFPGTAETRHEYWAYAAREVRQGQAPDARSDVFSFGRLLHFVLAGEDPDEPDEPLPKLDKLRDSPPGLVRIMRRATQRDPAQRYATMDALLEDLGRYQEADQVGIVHPDGLEGKERPKEAPSEPEAPPSRREPKKGDAKKSDAESEKSRQPNQAPIQIVVGPTRDESTDPIAGGRSLVIAAFGLAMLGGAAAMAYKNGEVTRPVQALAIGGTLFFSACLPGTRRWYLMRPVWAAVCITLVLLGDLAGLAADEGRKAKFMRGSPSQRANAVVGLARRGRKIFRNLDLSRVDFTGKDISALDFTGTKLVEARFVDANAAGAIFVDADLSHADFAGASLEGAEVTGSVGWRDALCNKDTRMPKNWRCVDGKPKSEHDFGPSK